MYLLLSLFFAVSLFVADHLGHCDQIVSRFEYKFSFKPPYLAQKDGMVPFWEYGGSMLSLFSYALILVNSKYLDGIVRNPSIIESYQTI